MADQKKPIKGLIHGETLPAYDVQWSYYNNYIVDPEAPLNISPRELAQQVIGSVPEGTPETWEGVYNELKRLGYTPGDFGTSERTNSATLRVPEDKA